MTRRTAFLDDLARRLAALRMDHPVRIGIDGVDAAGKTTLADELVAPLQALGCTVIRASIDGFHRPRVERYQLGRQSPEGYFRHSFNHDALINDLLAPLGPGGSRRVKPAMFDYRVDQPVDRPEERVPADAILLFDGVFLHRPELRSYWDATIFLDVPFEVSVLRAAQRDGWPPDVDASESRRYVDGQRMYLRECRPADNASIVVANGDVDAPHVTAVRAPFDGSSTIVPETQAQYKARILRNLAGREPLSLLAAAPDTLAALLASAPPALRSRRPAPGKWSVQEIVAHLADDELVGAYRIRLILADPGTDIQAFDQDRWAATGRYADTDPWQALALFRALREANLALWRQLSPDEWERAGVHAERGVESIRDILNYYAGHDLNHFGQIEAIIAQGLAGPR